MTCSPARLLVLSAGLLAACASSSRAKGGLVAHPELSEQKLARLSGKRLAVLVGVDQPRDEAWPRLQYASKDASALALVLHDQGHFDAEALITPSSATRANVLAALERLKQKNRSPEDVVVVYFSGHGTLGRRPNRHLERYLVTSDTTRAAASDTGLSVEELNQVFESLPSRRKVLILAACHSGSGKSRLPEEVEQELKGLKGEAPRPLSEVSRGVITLSASAWGEPAREDDGLKHDIYTHFFLEALVQRKDRNRDGAVSSEEAHDYARTRTYYFTQGRQTPTAESAVVGVDPVVLVGDPSEVGLPEVGSYDEAWNGAEVKIDGESVGALPGSMPVAPGKHRLQVLKGDVMLADSRVELSVGDRLDVSNFGRAPSPWLTLEARGGYQFLLTSQLRAQVGGSMPLVSVSAWLPRLLLRRLDLGLDLSFGRIGTDIFPDGFRVPVTLTLTELGVLVALPFTWGRFTVGVGPRLSVAWFSRSYQLAGGRGADSAFLTIPGLALDLRFFVGAGFSALLGARLNYSALMVDGVTTHLGSASGWAGVGYRFE